MSFEDFFSAKSPVALFISFEKCRNIATEAIKARVIDVQITIRANHVSYHVSYPITGIQLQRVQIENL